RSGAQGEHDEGRRRPPGRGTQGGPHPPHALALGRTRPVVPLQSGDDRPGTTRRSVRGWPGFLAPAAALTLARLRGLSLGARGAGDLLPPYAGGAIVGEPDGIALNDVAFQHRGSELRLELRPDLPPQLAGAVLRLVPDIGEMIDQ